MIRNIGRRFGWVPLEDIKKLQEYNEVIIEEKRQIYNKYLDLYALVSRMHTDIQTELTRPMGDSDDDY